MTLGSNRKVVLTDDEIERLAQIVADKVELQIRRTGRWPVPEPQRQQASPVAPQSWQLGGSPTYIGVGSSVSSSDPTFLWN